MVINKNRIADRSLIVKDLEALNADVNTKNMETSTEVKPTEAKDVLHVKETRGSSNMWDSQNDANQLKDLQKIKQLLKMLGASMAIFGIYNIDNLSDANHSRKEGPEKKPRPTRFQIHSVYCYVVLICMFAVLVRSTIAFFVGEHAKENITFRIVVATWSLQVTLNAFIMFKATHPRWGNLGLACQTWDTDVLKFMNNLNVGLNTKKIKRYLSVIFVAGWLSIVLNICLVPAFLFLYTSEFSKAFTNVLIAPFPENDITKVILCCISIYMTIAWIVPCMYLVALCFVLRSGFKVCKKALTNTIALGKETNTYPECLYRQRMLHLNLSRFLEIMDKDLKYMYAALFFTNIPLACFIVYQLLETQTGILETCALLFWLGSNVLFVCFATLAGAAVNSAAHSPLDCIYDVGMKGISLEQLGQLNLFTSKLNGGAIAFTVMTFVPVTKELFLTVGGLYITYFFVLLQF